jgi:hypothetical protein
MLSQRAAYQTSIRPAVHFASPANSTTRPASSSPACSGGWRSCTRTRTTHSPCHARR